ncbi:hypothetical protein LRP88_14953 [Fusarium phalaenopsidis]
MDWRIVPLATLLYLLCFLDRANIGNARIQGLGQDLKLDGLKFNWALSVFYITYLLFEVPSNILLKRFGPRFYLPFLVWAFGLVSLCTAFVDSFAGLLVARSVLGVFEGGTMPGLAFLFSCFYKRNELMLRVGFFIAAAGLAGAFGGLLAAALSRIPEWGAASVKIHTWRNIFFFEGLLTVFIGLAAPIWLPNSPAEASFLTARERQIAVQRLALEEQEKPENRVTRQDVRRAMMSVHNYTCGLGSFFINVTIQGLAMFLPTILADLQWSATKAQLMTVPPNLASSMVTVLMAHLSDRARKRGPFIMALSTVAAIGLAVLRWQSQPYVRYMGVFLVMCGAGPGGPAFLSWGINNAAGPSVRAVTSAYVVTLGTFGGLVATWTYLARDAPAYHVGHMINFGGQIAVVCLALLGILYCVWENKARAAGKRDYRLANLSEAEQAKLGHDHPSFRYMM